LPLISVNQWIDFFVHGEMENGWALENVANLNFELAVNGEMEEREDSL
jgi:hypothetical protein